VAGALAARGASFASELGTAGGPAPAEAESALWELVSAGLATCDGFGGLRGLLAGDARRGGGRWALLRGWPPAPGDQPLDPVALEQLAQLYLRRYGVVFRDLLAREAAPPWRELVRVYRTLEARGAVRGGRFVASPSGEQFALPEALDALRAVRRAPRDGRERVELSAADPLNLVGVVTPGPRIPAQAGARVVCVDGVPAVATAAAPAAVTSA
jgi:ATP-dependent Lhr-like helicase